MTAVSADEQNCLFCHAVATSDADTVTCPACQGLHHAECWAANRGCARAGCASAAAAVKPSEPSAQAGSDGAASQRQARLIVAGSAAIVVGALAALGIAIASRGDDVSIAPPQIASVSAVVTSPPAAPPRTAAAAEPQTLKEKRAFRLGDPAQVPKTIVRRRVKKLLVDVHRAQTRGDWQRAYSLLSRRKQRDKAAAAGRPGDKAAGVREYRRLLAPLVTGLQAKRLQLMTLELDGRVAIVSIRVPRDDGGCYAGTSWLFFHKKVGWRFDPGFENRPGRRGAPILANRGTPC